MSDNVRAYAGIGSRKSPVPTLALMRQLAARLASLDWTRRVVPTGAWV